MRQDEELVRRHLLGDEEAFPELVRRYLRTVYNLAIRSTGDVMEAENIVQETFARAYAALPRNRELIAFKPWLLTIAINLCRNWARRARQQPALAAPDSRHEGDEEETLLEQVPDPAPGPLEALMEGETNAALERAVASLPLPYRQVIILRYMEGLSYEELAQALDLPLNTVRTHLSRAKERLRQALMTRQEGEEDGLPGDSAASGPLHGRGTEPGRGTTGPRSPRPVLGLPE